MSDLTRLAIQRVADDHAFEAVGSSIQALTGRVTELERRLDSLGVGLSDAAKT